MERKSKHPRVNFKIGSCTTEDPDCPASQLLLQTPGCKGWQSGRYCAYPQIIVLQLPEPYAINQITLLAHQYKIPSKVEVEYLISNDDQQYKRLGYFSMGNNMESNFQVRQLKNIPVSIQCSTVKFTMHKNHINKFNVFNQVGVISICLYGLPSETISNPIRQKYTIPSVQSIQSSNQGEKSSSRMIQELEIKKKEAIENQDYQTAGKIKAKIDNIRKVHTQLDDLQQRKKLAVQKQDYDTARTLHEQVKRIKQQFERGDTRHNNQHIREQPKPQHSRQPQHQPQPQQQQQEYYQPPVKKVQTKRQNPVQREQQNRNVPKKPLNVDDIPINVKNTNPYQAPSEQEQQTDNAQKKLQTLKGEQLKLCQQYFDVIDEQVWMMIFSRHHSYREEGIQKIRQIINSPGNRNKNNLVKAIFVVTKVTLDDKIVNILVQSQDLFYCALQKFKPKINDPNVEAIIHKVADLYNHNNDKVRESTSQLMRQLPNFQITNKNVCIKVLSQPEGKKSPKCVAGRLEGLKTLVQNYGSGDYLEECALYGVKNVQDKTSQVRNSAIQLIKTLINQVGYQRISSYLKNLRPAILKQFQDVDEKQQMPSNRQQVPINRKTQYKKTQEEQVFSSKAGTKKPRVQQPPTDMCPYCQKRDPQFQNQDYRDIHLYNTCVMLMLCECQQAIEVSSLSSHLTSECKNSKYYKKCPRCKEAVHQGKYKSHVQAKDCNPAKPLAVANRCPLCHEDITSGIGGWKQHLVDIGCPNNSR